jgi:hypothetical protein
MTQLTEKFSLRRIMIVFLIILVPATAISINNASWAEPIKNSIKAYVAPVLTAAGAINIFKNAKDLVHDHWRKLPRKL